MKKAREPKYRINGRVIERESSRGITGLHVEAWDKDLLVDDLVGSATTDAVGRFNIEFGRDYFSELFFDRRPDLFFKIYQDSRLLASTENSVLWNVECDETEITIEVASCQPSQHPAAHRSVEGQVFFDNGAPAVALALRFYNRGFGGAETRLGEVKTDDRGFYSLTYDDAGKQVNLEARMVDPQGQELSLSAVKYNAATHEVLNLIAPAKAVPLAPEYERLTADLLKQVGDLNKLADARENGERQDLTMLHQATGWDARLIALVVLAVRLNRETGLQPEVLYALFRTGLPMVKEQLALVSANTILAALYKATGARLVNLSPQEISQAKDDFIDFAGRTRSDVKAPGALSTFGDLLAQAGLTERDENIFRDLYFAHQGSGAELWQAAREQGLSEATIDNLRVQGKLAYLTLNNARLTGLLKQAIDSPEDLSQLVEMDLHKAEEWKARVNGLAGNRQALDDLIPPAYTGQMSERLDAYAADLARKVRVSFPTQVVARMIQTDELNLGEGHKREDVHAFLGRASGLGFELGRMPVDKFVRDNRDSLFRMNAPEEEVNATAEGVKKLQRVYQITPSNESLKALLDHGFSSAHEVTALTRDEFVDRVGASLPSRTEAELVYRKAQQVSAVAHNLLISAKQLDRTPGLYALSTSTERREAAIDNLITHYPRMETLFGSLDFCECEECRSVLSPAAYFVDLLQFLDRDENTWQGFLVDWENKHDKAPYPFKDHFEWERFKADWKNVHNNEEYPDTKNTPYDVLVERRPDLPHLSLTCENTQTALPYIDLVNEILEYYVANHKLDAAAVHDAGTTTTEQLLAEPQNLLPEAYTALKAERYPLSLPFDLWLETVRIFCSHFETPFWQVLEVFRPADDLYAPNQNAKPYYRADIFTEYLGLSAAEFAMFTDDDPLKEWHLLYGFDDSRNTDNQNQQAALAALKSAKNLAHTLGVSYKELIHIVRTNFINPALAQLVIVEKLGLDVSDITQYFAEKGKSDYADEKKAIEERFKTLDHTYHLAAGQTLATLTTLQNNGAFKQVLLLKDTSKSCDFDQTFLQFGDGQAAGAMVFLKINLFVRLWRKLGWTLEETDRALQVFLPKNSDLRDATKLGAAVKTALLYLAHLEALDQRLEIRREGRQKLLTLWSNLGTTGPSPLYAQLFLVPGALKNDAVFDQPFGEYLRYLDVGSNQYKSFRYDHTLPEDVKAGNVGLRNHLLAVQGALNLSAKEIELILSDAGKELSMAELSLDNVSLLYRYGFLAEALKLSIRDLIVLKDLSALDPFAQLESDPITKLADDYPFTQTLRFIEEANTVRESGFTIPDLDYLLRHRFDPVGKYRPNADALLMLVKSVAGGVQKILKDNPVPARSAHTSLNDDALRHKLALVLPSNVVETFFAMWTGTVEYQEVQENVNQKLDPASFADEPAIHVSYDEVKKTQRLIYRGVMIEAERQRLTAKFGSLSTQFGNIHKQATDFFAAHLQKDQDKRFGFLNSSDFETLFAPLPTAGLTNADRKTNEEKMLKKRDTLVRAFLPFLQQRLIGQLLGQTMALTLNADPSLTDALMSDAHLLADPSEPTNPSPLLDAFAAVSEPGLSLTFFSTPDSTGSELETTTVTVVDTKLDPNNSKRGVAKSARFEGYLEVPADGAYRFFVSLDNPGLEAEFRLDLTPPTIHAKNQDKDDFVSLKSGVIYRVTFDVHNLDKGDARLFVQSENLPKGEVDRLTLYPEATVERFRRAYVLLAKTLQLAQGLSLNEREIRYLLTHAVDFDNLDLNNLPTRAADYQPASAKELFKQFLRLAAYVRVRRDLDASSEDLVGVFETKLLSDACRQIAVLTRRDETGVSATAKQLQLTAGDLVNELGVERLWRALQVVEKLGVQVESIAGWLTPTPDRQIAQDLKDCVKAGCEHENWQRLAQPIFNRLRQRQRDALADCIMHRRGFERIEQLFEYFLIDPGMEPVVLTSRLRLAISSVQTFIQRCFMSLEAEVDPTALNSNHWQWMKRYRVWEANRKIFLFPENWLEPEFRDDKTHLFQELEGALLQGDVSNDLAEDAFFNYLNKLEEIAQLEMVTMYIEEKPDAESNILHLIGRTQNLPRKYFYRRYDHHMWTPWEPVDAEIEGDHVLAVLWRERLHLFWLTFIEKGKLDDGQGNGSIKDAADNQVSHLLKTEVEIQLNWSEYFQGQWQTRKSSGFGNPLRITVPGAFDRNRVFIHLSKQLDSQGGEGGLKIYLVSEIGLIAELDLQDRHTCPQPKVLIPPDVRDARVYAEAFLKSLQAPYSATATQPTTFSDSNTLKVTFESRIEKKEGENAQYTQISKDILQPKGVYSLVRASDLSDFLLSEARVSVKPFFWQDKQYAFLVEPTVSQKTVQHNEDFGVAPTGSVSGLGNLENITNQSQVPLIGNPPPLNAVGHFTIQPNGDWLTRSTTTVALDGHFVGQSGRVGGQIGFNLGGGINLIERVINSSLEERNGEHGLGSTIG